MIGEGAWNKPTPEDKELAKTILVGLMQNDVAIFERGASKHTPGISNEIVRLYKIAIKCVKGSR